MQRDYFVIALTLYNFCKIKRTFDAFKMNDVYHVSIPGQT